MKKSSLFRALWYCVEIVSLLLWNGKQIFNFSTFPNSSSQDKQNGNMIYMVWILSSSWSSLQRGHCRYQTRSDWVFALGRKLPTNDLFERKVAIVRFLNMQTKSAIQGGIKETSHGRRYAWSDRNIKATIRRLANWACGTKCHDSKHALTLIKI